MMNQHCWHTAPSAETGNKTNVFKRLRSVNRVLHAMPYHLNTVQRFRSETRQPHLPDLKLGQHIRSYKSTTISSPAEYEQLYSV
jgi:hypothetical protein